jgi:hypothetical protein
MTRLGGRVKSENSALATPSPSKKKRAKIPPGALWAMASRVYSDTSAGSERERWEGWMHRASRALAECGNYVHIPKMIDTCNRLEIAPPFLLSRVLAVVLEAAASGATPHPGDVQEALGGAPALQRKKGRHGSVVREAAAAVLAIESLWHYQNVKAHLAQARKTGPVRLDALDETVRLFNAGGEVRGIDARTGNEVLGFLPIRRGGTLPRTRAALEGQIKNARILLDDEFTRVLIGPNFPPALLSSLRRTD